MEHYAVYYYTVVILPPHRFGVPVFGIENELSRQGYFFYRYKDKDFFNPVQ